MSIILSAIRKLLGSPHSIEQVEDDFEILVDSLKLLAQSSPLYHPGPYWSRHRKPLVEYIRDNGLKDFRLGTLDKADPKYIFRRFGAAEPLVSAPEGISQEQWNADRVKFAQSYGRLIGAKPLDLLTMSPVGHPGDGFKVSGRFYTTNALNFYLRYVYLCRFIDFDQIDTIVEIGPGSGLQTEVLKKLHPNLSFYLFDIPPQSYICNQYLKHVFGGDVIGLRETMDRDTLPRLRPGQIGIFNSWQIASLESVEYDLLWNSASFNEMEPNLVKNYLSLVGGGARFIYLLSIMQGSRVGMEDYVQFLGDMFSCKHLHSVLDSSGAMWDRYYNSVWFRK